jgi:hypothetical protein
MKRPFVLRIIRSLFISFIVCLLAAGGVRSVHSNFKPDGPKSYELGKELFDEELYDEAAVELWNAVLFHSETEEHRTYDVQAVFTQFLDCYKRQDKLVDGMAFVALESYRRGQLEMGKNYLRDALTLDPNNAAALAVQREFEPEVLAKLGSQVVDNDGHSDDDDDDDDDDGNSDVRDKTPEQLYEMASQHFVNKEYDACADLFEMSCLRSNKKLYPSCANAVYCRSMIVDYGFNGTQFVKDMKRIQYIIQVETKSYRTTTALDGSSSSNGINHDGNESTMYHWRRASSVHPHMMLGYTVDPLLKRYVAESVAYMDETMSRATSSNSVTPLPSDLPYSIEAYRDKFTTENAENRQHYRIRVGFVGSGFNSKAVLFLSQDMFRFFNTEQFEIHVFSFGPPDHAMFIQHGMRNVDWRERVKSNVDYFHDLLEMNISKDHIASARYIHDQNIQYVSKK